MKKSAKSEKIKVKIKGEMTLGEVVERYPKAVPVMLSRGLHCVGCCGASFETVEQGALAHGMGKKELKEMLNEMNKALNK